MSFTIEVNNTAVMAAFNRLRSARPPGRARIETVYAKFAYTAEDSSTCPPVGGEF